MARKPAPVQVSHMAYPATTGLAAIEYRIADPHLDPPGESEQHNAEQLARLPDCWWCYTPEADEPPVNALPAAQRGYVTFGQLNNLLKLNAVSVALWSRVLHSTPGSRFALLTGRGADAHRYIRSCFASHGIGADRLEVVRPALAQRYLQSYQSIDIGLDPIPYNGHMTSLDACWMGVPVVTLRGNTSVGRAGVSINLNLSLPELTASTADEYVQIASGLARDLPRLATLRATLRERMKRSPIMDAPRYTRALEVLYHNMWDRFCAQSTAG
jgi:predicted O-linked N-acetylglucosamine transferase (SPINDLY family)